MATCTNDLPTDIIGVLYEPRGHTSPLSGWGKTLFLFVKYIDIPDADIWKRIEKNTLRPSDTKWISAYLPLVIQKHIGHITIRCIQDTLSMEDTILTLRKKITTHLSNTIKRFYAIPEFQQLWTYPSLTQHKHPIPLGTFYEPIPYVPSIQVPPHVDYDQFIDMDGSLKMEIREVSNVYMILQDCLTKEYPLVHVAIVLDELEECKQKGIPMTDLFWKGYIQRYWPKVLQSKVDSIQSQQKDFFNIQEQMNQYNVARNFLHSYEIPKNQVQYCSVHQVTFHVDFNYKEKVGHEKNIDLLKLFYTLKQYVSEEVPFIKYIDPSWDSPYCILDTSVMEKRMISKKTIKKWVFGTSDEKKITGELKEQIHKAKRSLQIKLLDDPSKHYTETKTNNYITITITSKGTADIRQSYEQTSQAYFHNIYHMLQRVQGFMNKLNEYDVRMYKTLPKDPLPIPQSHWEKGNLLLGENTTISFINFYIPVTLPFTLSFEDLYKMVPLFSNYITFVEQEDTKKKLQSFEVRYNRVSNFINLKDMYAFIEQKKQEGLDEYSIQIQIQEQYSKTPSEASQIIYEYKKFLKSILLAKGDTNIPSGVRITLRQNVIQLYHCKHEEQLMRVVWFIRHFLGCYQNLGTIESSLMKLGYSSLAKWESKEGQEEFYTDMQKSRLSSLSRSVSTANNEIDQAIFSSNSNLQLGIDLEEYLEGEEEEEEEQIVNVNTIPKQTTDYQSSDLAPDSMIGKDIQLRCDDAIKELDTCADICNDDKYILRRLQRYDNVLFRFTAKKFHQYARICSKTQEQQPLVLPYDPTTNPKINPKSYTYFVRAGSNVAKQHYYICPKVWCPFCQLPILIDEVTNIHTRMTKSGRCQTGTCPNGNHQVMILASDYFEGLKKERYPGFIEPAKHPEGYCLPCCYKKPYNDPKYKDYILYKRCIGEEVQLVEADSYYILGKEKIPLEEHRYGILPHYVAQFFKTTCDTGYMEHGTECFLRYGINQIVKPSFLHALYIAMQNTVNSLVEHSITFANFRHYLKQRCTRSLFMSLHQGALVHMFKDPLGNIKDPYEYYLYYLEHAPSINEQYVWDFISRPGILYPDGLNLFMFSKTENDHFVCPIGFNPATFFAEHRPSIFLIHMKSFYEPIAFIKRDMQGKLIRKMVFDRNDAYVSRAMHTIQQHCTPKYDIDWLAFLHDALSTMNVNTSSETVLKTLAPPSEMTYENWMEIESRYKLGTIDMQLVDTYGKCVGLIYEDHPYIPIEPHGMLENIPVANMHDVPLYSMKDTYTFYKDMSTSGLKEFRPIAWIAAFIPSKKDMMNIQGILLYSGRMIPVKSMNVQHTMEMGLPVYRLPYYPQANMVIEKGIMAKDQRTENISYLEFEQESYERFRLECGTYMQSHPSIKQQIMDILYRPEQTISEKRILLLPILESMMSKCITYQRPKGDSFDYSSYEIPNNRMSCMQMKKGDVHGNPHCVWNDREKHAKLYLEKTMFSSKKPTFSFFVYRLMDELLRNRLRRDEVLQLTIPDILDKKKMDVLPGQFLLTENQPLKKLLAFYTDVEEFGVDEQVYDVLQPDIDEEEWMKYRIRVRNQWYDIPSDDLTSQWASLLPNYKVFHFTEYSMWQSLTQLGNQYMGTLEGLKEILEGMISSQFSSPLWKKWFMKEYSHMTMEDIHHMFSPLPLTESFDITTTQPQEYIIQLAKQLNPDIWKGIDTWEQFTTFFMQPTYEGSEMELAYVGKKLGIQIAILYKRTPKHIPLGLTCVGNVEKRPKLTCFFYSKIHHDLRTFSMIHRDELFVIPNEMIPGRMYQLMLQWYRKQATLLPGMSNTIRNMMDRVESMDMEQMTMTMLPSQFKKKKTVIHVLKKKPSKK